MTPLNIVLTNSFQKDYSSLRKRNMDVNELWDVVELLRNRKSLPPKYKDHKLKGKYSNQRECHIHPDWLLIYAIDHDKLILTLTRTCTHSDLFK